MIFVVGISISLFIAALLVSKKNKSGADKILLCWMLLDAFHLFLFYLTSTEQLFDYPFLLGLEFPMPLLHGVFLYLYVASITDYLPSRKRLIGLHFIPALLTYAYLIHFFMLSAAEKIAVYQNDGAGYELFQTIILLATFLSGVAYVFWSGRLLARHRKRIRNEFSSIGEINLRWLRLLTIGIGVIWTLVIFTQNSLLIFTALSVFVIVLGFFGIQQKHIFSDTPLIDSETNPNTEELTVEENIREKYQNSGLTNDQGKDLFKQLSTLMSEQKVFKNNELKLNELASQLDVHPNHLSQVINERAEVNFYDFVNTYRVEEFKMLIAMPKNQAFTIISLAYECGFNSKSSFNRYFKKHTGQTPSEYLSSIRKLKNV